MEQESMRTKDSTNGSLQSGFITSILLLTLSTRTCSPKSFWTPSDRAFRPSCFRAIFLSSSGDLLLCTSWKPTMYYCTRGLRTKFHWKSTLIYVRTCPGFDPSAAELQSIAARIMWIITRYCHGGSLECLWGWAVPTTRKH
eukprot:571007-Rhodomonas_salina.1